MKIRKLSFTEKRPEGLLSLLKGNVFHLTKQESCKQIINDGKINNNKDGIYNLNTSSQNSYGRNLGYVCLFDLREHNFDKIPQTLDCCDFFGPSWFKIVYTDYCEYKMAYFILGENFHSNLILYKDANLNGSYNQAVPHTEVWVENYIAIEWISTIYQVTIRVDAPLIGSLARIHHELALENKKKKDS